MRERGCFVFSLLFLQILFGCHEIIGQNSAHGPDRELFIGDFETFTCNSSSKNTKWVYRFPKAAQGILGDIPASDIIKDTSLDSVNGAVFRQSLIRIKQNLEGIMCFDADHESEIADVSVSVNNKLASVDYFEQPNCEDTPKIILKRWNKDFRSSQVWLSHYVTNENVEIPSAVSGFKLTCFSKQSVKWVISDHLDDFHYKTYHNKDCHFASLVISPSNPSASQKFICSSENKDSTVNLQISPIRMIDQDNVLDFNKTQQCIEHLGTTVFGNQSLAWSTAGSSALSIGMMIGIVFLKKQLEKQKQTNNNTS